MARPPADPSILLAELTLDRSAAPVPRRRRRWWPIAVLVAVIMAAAAVLAPGRSHHPAHAAPPAAAAGTDVTAGTAGLAAAGSKPQPADAAPDGVLDASGYVVARREATVSAKTTGKVEAISMEEGTTVHKGQVIARLDDSVERAELALAKAQADAARSAVDASDAEVRYARRRLSRTRALAVQSLASQADLDQQTSSLERLEAQRQEARRQVVVAERRVSLARRRVDDMAIRAPFTGVVVNKAAQPGEMISPNSAGGGFTRTGLGTIVDMKSLEVEVDVNEAYIRRVHAAQPAVVTLNAYPDRTYPAHVLTIVPTADRAKATVSVRVGFDRLDDRILPEMGVRVAFLGVSREEDQPRGDPS